MKRSLLIAITVAAAALLPSAAAAAVPAPDVPSVIAVTGNEKPFLAAHAEGVQIYACRSGAWALVAPRATLYGDNGQVIASHSGGPTWQARDGSRVKGSRVDGVTVPGAIQWLLLSRASSSAGSDGDRQQEGALHDGPPVLVGWMVLKPPPKNTSGGRSSP